MKDARTGESRQEVHGLAAHTLGDVAHARTGDKGDVCSIAVIAWSSDLYSLLLSQVTEDAVRSHFKHRTLGQVKRYELPRLNALNFVIEGALDGGVNSALNLDAHGKSFAFFLLGLPVAVPKELHGLLRQRDPGLLSIP